MNTLKVRNDISATLFHKVAGFYDYYIHLTGKTTQISLFIILFLVFGYGNSISFAQEKLDQQLSIPAQFLHMISPPGNYDHFLRPGRIFYDPGANEILVADPGHNRIVIFNNSGTYLFEISLSGYLGTIRDFVVTSEGYIIVLGSTSNGTEVIRFDFDGKYLGLIEVVSSENVDLTGITSISIDDQDCLYLLDHQQFSVVRITANSKIFGSFTIFEEMDEKIKRELSFGEMIVAKETIYIPVSSSGTVYKYSTSGEFLGLIGHQGTTTAGMSFPIAVAVTDEQIVLVLDKLRFNVQCYTTTGTFIGEFGGKGSSPGWFYFPSHLAVDQNRNIYIGQIFLNRVQVCQLPEQFYKKFLEISLEQIKPDNTTLSDNKSDINLSGITYHMYKLNPVQEKLEKRSIPEKSQFNS